LIVRALRYDVPMGIKAQLMTVVVLLALAGAIIYFWNITAPKEWGFNQNVACTMEAKLCPDGSAVGRSGPNCEFAQCPATATSTSGSSSTGSGSSGVGILPYNSGIRGTVMLGPTCPVMRDPPDPQCSDRGYETEISIARASDAVIATTKSDAQGNFEVSLPPGEYVVSAAGGKMLPRCSPVTVTVSAGEYFSAKINCDTGIR
jgi:hypothetical protein